MRPFLFCCMPYTFLRLGAAVVPSIKRAGYISMTQDALEKWIKQLIAEDKLYKFYKCKEWRQLSEAVMKENNYECQHCKKRGFHTPARSVHHVQWVRRHPRLALSRTYVYNGVTYNNLIPLCEDCHNKEHDKGKGWKKENKNKFVNEERW